MTDQARLAELRRLAELGEAALADECTRIIADHVAVPLGEQAVERLARFVGRVPRLTDLFQAGMVVELDPSTVEFRRFGDRYGTVVEPRAKNVRVWLHTSKRVRSIRPGKLRPTGDVDMRDPAIVVQDRWPEVEAALLAALERRRQRARNSLADRPS